MWFFKFIFFIPVTLLFFGLTVISILYLVMGFRQIVMSVRAQDRGKLQSGGIAFLLSAASLSALLYIYFKWIWLW